MTKVVRMKVMTGGVMCENEVSTKETNQDTADKMNEEVDPKDRVMHIIMSDSLGQQGRIITLSALFWLLRKRVVG